MNLKKHLIELHENANRSSGVSFLCDSLGNEKIKALWLKYYGKLGNLHTNGDLHIHDMNKLTPYSISLCMENVLSGFKAENIFDLFGHLFRFFIGIQREWAGAIHFDTFDVFISPYIHELAPSKGDLTLALKFFLSDIASHCDYYDGFLSIGLDLEVIHSPAYNFNKYAEYKREVHLFNECLYAVMNGNTPFVFPIIHIGLTNDFFKRSYSEAILKNALTYGNTYFHNFMNGKKADFINMCCRLRINRQQIKSKTTGSIGCVSINMARIGRLTETEKELFEKLNELVFQSINILRKKEKLLTRLLKDGIYPLSSKHKVNFKNFYKTIGINGVNEMILNFTKGEFDVTSEYGLELAEKCLQAIRAKIEKSARKQELIHLEATPCEGATSRFAKQDIKSFGHTFFRGKNTNDAYYTNSSQLPDGYSDDLYKNLQLQTKLQKYYDGGTVFHVFINSREYDTKTGKELLKRILSNFTIPTITYSASFYVCKDHGYSKGENELCPRCGNKMQMWGRVMGYMRPVNNFSNSKKNEFFSRVSFKPRENIYE